MNESRRKGRQRLPERPSLRDSIRRAPRIVDGPGPSALPERFRTTQTGRLPIVRSTKLSAESQATEVLRQFAQHDVVILKARGPAIQTARAVIELVRRRDAEVAVHGEDLWKTEIQGRDSRVVVNDFRAVLVRRTE